MTLIPVEWLDKLQKQRSGGIHSLTTPLKYQVTNGLEKVGVIAQSQNMSDEAKTQQYTQSVLDNSPLTTQLTHPSTQQIATPPADLLKVRGIPPKFQKNADQIALSLESHPGTISWDGDTREVTIEGRHLPGSNIDSLIGHVVRSRKSDSPDYGDDFWRALASINLPEELVKNKYQFTNYQLLRQLRTKPTPQLPSFNTPQRTSRRSVKKKLRNYQLLRQMRTQSTSSQFDDEYDPPPRKRKPAQFLPMQ